MIKRSNIFTRICVAMYITIMFMVVIPLHHHDDGAEHDDCAVCIIGGQPCQISDVINIVFVSIPIFITVQFLSSFLTTFSKCSFDSRAPPLI